MARTPEQNLHNLAWKAAKEDRRLGKACNPKVSWESYGSTTPEAAEILKTQSKEVVKDSWCLVYQLGFAKEM